MKVNGTVVRSYPSYSNGPFGPAWAPSGLVVFDSTHFASGSTVTVRGEADWVLTRNGVGTSRSLSCERQMTVKNASTLFGRYDMDITPKNSSGVYGPDTWKALPTVSSFTTSMGYTTQDYVVTLGWSNQDFYDKIEAGGANVVHIHTHGNADGIWDDQNDYNYPPSPPRPPGWIVGRLPTSYPGATVILPARQTANGNGLPPLNGSGHPPINLAFIDGCNTGTNNQWGEGFLYPYGNSYSGVSSFPEDQACVGYAVEFTMNFTEQVQVAFYGKLASGFTVDEARTAAYFAFDVSSPPSSASDFMHIFGDQTTRLKGVYTGNRGQETRWYN